MKTEITDAIVPAAKKLGLLLLFEKMEHLNLDTVLLSLLLHVNNNHVITEIEMEEKEPKLYFLSSYYISFIDL